MRFKTTTNNKREPTPVGMLTRSRKRAVLKNHQNTPLSIPKKRNFVTHVFTDRDAFEGYLSRATRKKFIDACGGSISSQYFSELASDANSKRFWVVAVGDEGVNYFDPVRRNDLRKRRELGGFATATMLDDPRTGMRTVYIDLVCSSGHGRGGVLVSTVLAIARVLGARLARLSALPDPRAMGLYAKFGFRRVPNACVPDQQYATSARRNDVFGPIYSHGNALYGNAQRYVDRFDGPDWGYVMSACLPPADAEMRNAFDRIGAMRNLRDADVMATARNVLLPPERRDPEVQKMIDAMLLSGAGGNTPRKRTRQ